MLYIGHRHEMPPEIFRAKAPPTQKTHGHTYFAATGPFRTKRAAQIMAAQGASGNPCFQTVSDCERQARKERG